MDGLVSVSIGDSVKKRGKVTGLTFGTVTGLLAAGVVHDGAGAPIWWLLGQMRVEVDRDFSPDGVWSRPGDSGAVILNLADEVVGLHWGSDTDDAGVGFATDIFVVTTALGLVPG